LSKYFWDRTQAVVTGSLSGIGKETALMLAKHNFLTYATMRSQKGRVLKSHADKEKLSVKIIELDVTKNASIKNTIESIIIRDKAITGKC